jgi:hypothetical protein
MTNSTQQHSSGPLSGHDVFAEVISLSRKRMTEMLVRMIQSAQDYHNWGLADDDAADLVKLIRHKQRIICSSFVFQLNRNFADFKAADGSLSDEKGRYDWQQLGLSAANDSAEIEELERITDRYRAAFKDFDRNLLKRLQACVRRPRANIYENPLQVKRLCESFRYAIDSLDLKPDLKIALYQLFADRLIESLGPLYRSIELYLLEQRMLPEIAPAKIHLRSIDGLSESKPPPSLNLNQSACLLILLQDFKEKSRVAANRLQNYFPELKQRFGRYGIAEYDEQIDQLNLIFKLIFEDEDLPAPIKQQLARLQIYIFITAVQEDGFLRRSTNPARRLLDGIISKEVEIAHNGSPELSGERFIREHIDNMASLQFITVDHYAEMLEEYQKFITENSAAIRRQRKLEATRKVLPLVKERLAEITQPLRVQGTPLILFEKVWLPLLVQIALQRGMDSEPWHKSIAMVQKQVWSLIPKNSPEEQAELIQVLPTVAHSLHRAMRSLKLAESLQQSMRDFLKLEQQNVAEQTARNIIEARRKTRSLSAQSFAPSDDDPSEFDAMMQTGVFQIPTDMLNSFKSAKPEPPKKINQIEALAIGEWVSFKESEGSKLAKLAWKAEDSTLFIFVDRDGKRVCEVDADTLSNQFETGAVSLSGTNTTDSKKSLVSFMKSL